MRVQNRAFSTEMCSIIYHHIYTSMYGLASDDHKLLSVHCTTNESILQLVF